MILRTVRWLTFMIDPKAAGCVSQTEADVSRARLTRRILHTARSVNQVFELPLAREVCKARECYES